MTRLRFWIAHRSPGAERIWHLFGDRIFVAVPLDRKGCKP